MVDLQKIATNTKWQQPMVLLTCGKNLLYYCLQGSSLHTCKQSSLQGSSLHTCKQSSFGVVNELKHRSVNKASSFFVNHQHLMTTSPDFLHDIFFYI